MRRSPERERGATARPHRLAEDPGETARYLAELLAELETLGRAIDQPMLAYLIGMARLEARRIVLAEAEDVAGQGEEGEGA